VPERFSRGSRQQSEAILNSFFGQWNFFIFGGRCDFFGGDAETMAFFCHETTRIRSGLTLISLIAL
jgi:hypothetical protein